MRTTPIPDSWTGPRAIVGPSDPTRLDLRACEYAIRPSREYPGRQRCLARVVLDDNDRAAIAAGAVLWVELDGAEVPWGLTLTYPDGEVPQ